MTYRVIRDGHLTPVYTVTANSSFWQRPTLTFTDSNLPSGTAHTYRVYVYDPLGNMVAGGSASVTVT